MNTPKNSNLAKANKKINEDYPFVVEYRHDGEWKLDSRFKNEIPAIDKARSINKIHGCRVKVVRVIFDTFE